MQAQAIPQEAILQLHRRGHHELTPTKTEAVLKIEKLDK